MSLSVYNSNSNFDVATVPTTLQTVSSQRSSIRESQVASILVEYNGEKKGGHGSTGHGSGGSGTHGGTGSGSGTKGGTKPGSYYYNGRNYEYGYPVYYQGNRYYPRGVILPVAFGGAAGYLAAGHIYHTYTSSDTLYYSEMPTVCGASGASAASTTSSVSGSQSCVASSSYSSFTDGGGLVTIQQDDLVSVAYSTLSDSSSSETASSSSSSTPATTTTSEMTSPSSSSSSSAAVSSISSTSKNAAAALQPGSNVVHYTGQHTKLTTLFSAVITTGFLISLM